MARPPRIPIWLPLDQVVTYFITICVAGKRRTLDNPETFDVIEAFCRANVNWRTLAAVVMPDHFHALISPLHDREASDAVLRWTEALCAPGVEI